MDEIMDFFDLSKDFVRKPVPQGYITSSNALVTEMHETKPNKREVIGTDYVNEIVENEKELLSKLDEKTTATNYGRGMNDLDSDDEHYESHTIRRDDDFYEKYHFNLNRNRNLPIYGHREAIVNAIKLNPVIIIKGDTGCGKTTQVPQYILDEAFKEREYCNIVVTQPRRIAAMSIAQHVAADRKWLPGTVCTYQVGLHRESDQQDTRILYCTTGVLLNNLISNKTLTHFTHIILDEIHERDQEMDFLLIVIRRLLALNSRHVKIILMSATIDERDFVQYFATKNSRPPVISASQGRKYPLVKFYRDQLKSIESQDHIQSTEPCITESSYLCAMKILMVIDNMERRAQQQSNIPYEESLSYGAVLIFLPGIREIDIMLENLQNMMHENPSMKMIIIRCHSLVTLDPKNNAFTTAAPGWRKIILSTNIAESSITVPDVSYVIDFCLTKILVTDTATNFSSLKLVWASKTNCRQRAGRVGRLRSGRVYRMVSKHFYKNCMSEFGVPEMLRSPLQNSVLKAKKLEMGRPSDILALALSPPNLSDIRNTIFMLKEVGALFPTVDGVYDELDGDLSYWGIIMARLPLEVHLSRLIIFGYVFNLIDEAIIIAAGLSVRSVYAIRDRSHSFDSTWMNFIWADGSGSDLISILRLYNTYCSMNKGREASESLKQWAIRFNLSLRSLEEMHLLVQDLRYRCTALKLCSIPMEGKHGTTWSDKEKSIVLKIIIAGAFYPNYFTCNDKSNVNRERDIYQSISGHDPCKTVYFTNFQSRYMGELYTRSIKELFLEANINIDKIDITFQPGSEKVFVTFNQTIEEAYGIDQQNVTHVPGRVMLEVYKAMRLRLESQFRPLRVMENLNALRYVQEQNIGEIIEGNWVPPCTRPSIELQILPSLYDKIISGGITYIVSCGKFFFQPQELDDCIANMTDMFNTPQVVRSEIRNASFVSKGLTLLAWRRVKYERATVIKVLTEKLDMPKFNVHFIDYGDMAMLTLQQLRLLPPALKQEYANLPPRMFECRLALVQPSTVSSCYNSWPTEANEMLHSMARCGRLKIEVYSLVNDVAAVIIHTRDGNFNEKLVERQWARRADEDYMSRQDHDFRQRKQESCRYMSLAERSHINMEYLRSIRLPKDENIAAPPAHMCTNVLRLKGPYSPLETSVYSTMRVGLWKKVNIERESVNGVLLDVAPQDQHDQMLVAATVSESDNGQAVTARATTLMPNIHGFGALMTMIFCPTMQVKCNKDKTRYVSLLAGLGYDKHTLESYYEEHDICVNLDVLLMQDDIRIVNQIRYFIDTMFFDLNIYDKPIITPEDRKIIFANLRSLLSRLLTKDRSYLEPHNNHADYSWEDITYHKTTEGASEPYGKRSIFPLHSAEDLRNDNMGTLLALQKNCTELYKWRKFEGTLPLLECKLCNRVLENVTQLRLHLLTQLHRDRERQISWRRE